MSRCSMRFISSVHLLQGPPRPVSRARTHLLLHEPGGLGECAAADARAKHTAPHNHAEPACRGRRPIIAGMHVAAQTGAVCAQFWEPVTEQASYKPWEQNVSLYTCNNSCLVAANSAWYPVLWCQRPRCNAAPPRAAWCAQAPHGAAARAAQELAPDGQDCAASTERSRPRIRHSIASLHARGAPRRGA